MPLRARLTGFLPALLLSLVCLAALRAGAAADGQRWAVLVGVGQYENAGLRPLPTADADARALAEVLVKHAGYWDDHVILMTSDSADPARRPTHYGIAAQMLRLGAQVRPEDSFLFYFVGHSARQARQQYLYTQNTDPTAPTSVELTALSLDMLGKLLAGIEAQKRVLVFDAWRDGPEATKGGMANPRTREFSTALQQAAHASGVRGGRTALLLSCGEGQRGYDWTDRRQGVFGYYLSEGLRGAAADLNGQVTLHGLGRYLQETLRSSPALAKLGTRQTPDVRALGAPDIVLLPAPSVPDRSEFGLLEVATVPPGAKVTLAGGDPAGKPGLATFSVFVGSAARRTVSLTVRAPGYRPRTEQRDVRAGQTTHLDIALMRLPTPPAAPANLTAAAAPGEVRLAWEDRSDNEQEFRIEQRSGSAAFTPAGSVPEDTTSYLRTGLRPRSVYTFRVRAINEAGASAPSNAVSVRVPVPEPKKPEPKKPPEPVKPPVPVLPAAPASFRASAASDTAVLLTWQDNSADETAFVLERYTEGSDLGRARRLPANTTSFEDTGLVPRTAYRYRLKARGAQGDSPDAPEATVTTLAPAPPAPSGLAAVAESPTSVRLSWRDGSDTETGFRLQRRSGTGAYEPLAQLGENVTSYVDRAAKPRTEYAYRVCAFNPAGASPFAEEARAATPAGVPSPAANLTASALDAASIRLRWLSGGGETGFIIERAPGTTGFFTLLKKVDKAVATFTDGGLPPKTTYSYRVRAANEFGSAEPSNVAAATTLQAPPAAPDQLTATAPDPTRVELRWRDRSDDETGFQVERKEADGSFARVAMVGANISAYADQEVKGAGARTYRVRAINGAGASPYSNEATVTLVREMTNPVDGAVLLYVPAGEYMMGSAEEEERPAHRVRLTRGSWVYRTEVTNAQYRKFVAAKGHRPPAYFDLGSQSYKPTWDDPRFNADDQPVVGVSWQDAVAYCKWAQCRLPTEAEWEYAARGSDGRRYPWGNEDPTEGRAVFGRNFLIGKPAAVGSVPGGASPFGLLDMAGNVWEWCQDVYAAYPAADQQDPVVTAGGDEHVARGGSFSLLPPSLTTTRRSKYAADARSSSIGFRCARTAE